MNRSVDNIRLLLALIQRSDDVGDGWRKVAPMLRILIEMRVAEAPGLYEIKDEEGGIFIRMTSDAEVLARYI